MSEWRTFKGMLRAPKSDIIVLLATFFLTVIIDLTVAIEVGMVLASFLFMYRMATVTNVSAVTSEIEDTADPELPKELSGKALPKGVQVYEINGPFFFGAAEKFTETIGSVGKFPPTLIIRMRNVPAMDATGIKALRDMVKHTKHAHSRLIIAEIHSQPLLALQSSGLYEEIGDANFYPTLAEALALTSTT